MLQPSPTKKSNDKFKGSLTPIDWKSALKNGKPSGSESSLWLVANVSILRSIGRSMAYVSCAQLRHFDQRFCRRHISRKVVAWAHLPQPFNPHFKAEKQGNWHCCEIEMPPRTDRNTVYLVTKERTSKSKDSDERYFVTTDVGNHDGFPYQNYLYGGRVVAWAPMPEFPDLRTLK